MILAVTASPRPVPRVFFVLKKGMNAGARPILAIGGGIAGMTAAVEAAEVGYRTLGVLGTFGLLFLPGLKYLKLLPTEARML